VREQVYRTLVRNSVYRGGPTRGRVSPIDHLNPLA
jgi:hypothetical protein